MDLLYKATLPLPPSLNGAYAGMARRHKSKAYKQWLLSAPLLEPQKLSGHLFIIYKFYFPNLINRDVSNFVKLCEDYLVSQEVLSDDNFKVVPGVLPYCAGLDKGNPRVEVEVFSIFDTVELKIKPYLH